MNRYTVEEATRDLLDHVMRVSENLMANYSDISLDDALFTYQEKIANDDKLMPDEYTRLSETAYLLETMIDTWEV